MLLLLGTRRRMPPSLVILLVGSVYTVAFKLNVIDFTQGAGIAAPRFHLPALADVWTGFLLLALPQVPLTIANAIVATSQVASDLVPKRQLSVRTLGLNSALINIVNSFIGGVPVSHASAAMTQHQSSGARPGTSVIIYGAAYLLVGLFLSGTFAGLAKAFPLPMLGVVLLFEGLALLLLARDTAAARDDFAVVLLVGLLASTLPYGYFIGLLAGTAIHHLGRGGSAGSLSP
jgi:MFS superfamily sulfate permease-like transporter